MKYTCKICSSKHEYYFGIRAGASQTLSAIKKDDSKRVYEPEKDYYLVDKSIAVFPAIVEIGTEHETPFWYETWVECNWEEFAGMSDRFKNEFGSFIEGKLYDNLVPVSYTHLTLPTIYSV